MSNAANGELVWSRTGGQIRLGVHGGFALRRQSVGTGGALTVAVSNVQVPWWGAVPENVVYRHPVELRKQGEQVVAGSVFAILAGSHRKPFHGNRAEYRDLLRAARRERKFVYVLPAARVTEDTWWRGYVRIGTGKWIALPCPYPQAVYNRIPTRFLERLPVVGTARARFQSLGIPMFNPSYFNKAELYQAIAASRASRYLPDTVTSLDMARLRGLLSRHRGVYLKPSGGSVGHGMMLAERTVEGYRLSVMKGSVCQSYPSNRFEGLWADIMRQRLGGNYVLQAAVPLIEWNESPCDFRVLLQKHVGRWSVTGVGVRVAGKGVITTHVPNGGYIMAADPVIQKWFGTRSAMVERSLEEAAVELAHTVDRQYSGALGEMSIDIGIDRQGDIWFFEANAKPMKFDEPDIRQRALQGVLEHLEELRVHSPVEIV
ncbi:YheC/YheD family endospore coat-associated protein [Alicyclobacillus sp. ALC3]|uniref:YheC/YheD family endospore coat-associated protein n=1 Tax=Alicyclobacillus sp. ALC3 TaxID=2796143 RepID=UPI00237847A9|nr:YheC/YheD family protein [Alicyclobacillus sp. ALC3]WDL97308.1 YheC/YheD family protein [Alicyclobacillus sp. ALC3]